MVTAGLGDFLPRSAVDSRYSTAQPKYRTCSSATSNHLPLFLGSTSFHTVCSFVRPLVQAEPEASFTNAATCPRSQRPCNRAASLLPAGKTCCRLNVVIETLPPNRSSDGTTNLRFDPIDLLERLAALTPRPRINLILYHGLLAPRAAWQPLVVGEPVGARDQTVPDPRPAVSRRDPVSSGPT